VALDPAEGSFGVEHAGRGSEMITHRFPLNDMETAYEVFSRPGDSGALKVLLTAPVN
jgi:hypothetical protein